VNIFGIGNLELVVIMLVALMVLGPARMVEVARTLGKFWTEAQQTLRSVADAATTRLDEPPSLNRTPAEPVTEPEDAVARPSTRGGDGEAPVSDEAPDREPTRPAEDAEARG
jgi:Sec-independent protein translocase protein TatA